MSDKILGISLDDINSLAEIVKNNKLTKINIKLNDAEITIESEKKIVQPASAPVIVGGGAAAAAAPAAVSAASAEADSEDSASESGNIVKSPIVGTFYASPSPDKPPFVRVGDTVSKGDVIMIIESMKLMNEVQSEFSGTVKKILVSNGSAVEFDQPVMIIE